MFGYIKPAIPELKVKEHELYKSIYCGLCRAMGEHICHTDRFTLSYDIVFLALVRIAATGEDIHVEKRRCMIHPIKKRNHAFIPETLKYCARVSALLTYYNILDDVEDSEGASSIKYRMLLPSAKKFKRRAGMPDIQAKIEALLGELSRLEKQDSSIDQNADCFGRLLAEIFAYDIEDRTISRAMYDTGYHCGKWIYIVDAADDHKKDIEKGEYNPLSSFTELPIEILKTSMTLELSEAHKAFNSIDTVNPVVSSIINNILTMGMPDVMDKILGENK